MKRILIVIVFCTCVVSGLHAQVSLATSFRIALPDTSGQQFFNRNTGIQGLLIEFEQEKPVSASLYQDKQLVYHADHPADEFYDLEFEGDKYLLKKKYEQIPIPVLPALTMESLNVMGDVQRNRMQYEVKAAVFKDSVIYTLNVWSYPETPLVYYYIMERLKMAGYNGDIDLLSKQMERTFQKNHPPSVADSVLIFRGIIHRDGSISDVEFIVGDSSCPFSTLIREELKASGRVWLPARKGGISMPSYVRIYARLHSDKRVTLDVSGRNGQKYR